MNECTVKRRFYIRGSQPFFANDTLDSIYEISQHTAFNSIIILIRLMLLEVTLEYMKFHDTPIALQL